VCQRDGLGGSARRPPNEHAQTTFAWVSMSLIWLNHCATGHTLCVSGFSSMGPSQGGRLGMCVTSASDKGARVRRTAHLRLASAIFVVKVEPVLRVF
jgi:hypothetical protein